MTCYETLRTPASAATIDAPMAHHFVKWWRNKFRNGYKKFSIGTESERTDTEELIGRASSQCSAPPDLLPSEARALLQPSTPLPSATRIEPSIVDNSKEHEPKPPPSPTINNNNSQHECSKPRLRFEELTCDVELQHPESSKQQPLQFSFTLYDLDGHGRMTKDDIAGIVSTIYESIGKSVTVPHYGSKTIQVRLTVIPEGGSSRYESRRRRRRERAAARIKEERRSPDRLSPDEDVSSKSSSCSEPRQQRRSSRTNRKEGRHAKKRSGSLQRRELLEIIQANMEKNHLSFQTSRKPTEPVVKEEDIIHKYQKLRNRSFTVSDKPQNTFQNPRYDAGNGYLDLAGADTHLCRYDRYLHAVICSSTKHAHTGYHHRQAPRSRPQPHPPKNTNANNNNTTTQPRVLQIIFL